MHSGNGLRSWLTRCGQFGRSGSRKRSCRLQIERLEERATPTASVMGLDPATDTGVSSTDGITNDSTPIVVGTATPGDTVEVFAGAASLGTVVADANGDWAFQVPTELSEGVHDLSAADDTGTGDHLMIEIDLTAPAAPLSLALAPASDSGAVGDNLTNVTNPTITGTAEPGSSVTVSNGATPLGSVTADGNGDWSFTPTTPLEEGEYLLTATATDVAGNTSSASAGFALGIDTTAPAAPANLTLDPDSDSGTVGDNLTNNTTPTLTGTAVAGTTVEVFDDVTSLGTTVVDQSGNWSLTPTNPLAEGSHTFTATATDVVGNTSTASVALMVEIDTTAPAAPADLALHPGSDTGTVGDNQTEDSTPTITGTAEPDSLVEVFDDGVLLGAVTADENGDWSFTPTIPLDNGDHVLTAKATDAADNTSSLSGELTLTIQDLTPPGAPTNLTLNPASDSGTAGDNLTNDTTPTITGNAEPGSTVELFDDGDSLGTTTTDASGFWIFNPAVALSEGSHPLTATATDPAGNTSTASATLTIEIDTTPPAAPLELTLDPASDSGTAGDNRTNDTTPTVTGTATAGSTIRVFDGSTSLGTTTADANGDWSFTVGVPLGEGAHTLTATATDAADNTSTASTALVVTIDTLPPTLPAGLTLTAGSDSGTVGDNLTNDSTPTISGTTEANATVEVFNAGVSLGTTVANGSGNWTFTPATALTDGVHVLTAIARDAAGNSSSTSAALLLTVDATPPGTPTTPDLIAASDTGVSRTDNITSNVSPTFTGFAEPNATVRVFAGNTLLGTVQANAAGAWTVTSPVLPDGTYAVEAQVTDAAGNVSRSAALTVVIDSTNRLANPLRDVTGQLRITRSRARRVARRTASPRRRRVRPARRRAGSLFRQTITITNTTDQALEGPLLFFLGGLDRSIRPQGTSASQSGSFVQLVPTGGSLAAGETVTFTLIFRNPQNLPIRFTPRVLAGTGDF